MSPVTGTPWLLVARGSEIWTLGARDSANLPYTIVPPICRLFANVCRRDRSSGRSRLEGTAAGRGI